VQTISLSRSHENSKSMKRKYNPEKATAAVRAATKMPPLRHQLPDEPFDIEKSEVAKWLSEQPEILKSMFAYYHDKGAIVFDQESKTWQGNDFQAENL
jgi:hypothetical protein